MPSDTLKTFSGQITEGSQKAIPKDNCYRMKNMRCLENKFLTRAGYKKYNLVPYDAHINLIYEFKRVVGGHLDIIGFGGNLYEGYPVPPPWTTLGGFSDPYGIYYDPASGHIYVANSGNNRIVKTKIDGTGWQTLGGFSDPCGIHYDPASEYIYVANSNNHRIVKTQIDGTGWTTYGSGGSGVGKFSDPYGIYYDPASGHIYVADQDNNRIVKAIPDWS